MSRLLLILPLVCMLVVSGCSEAREEPGPAAPAQAKGTPEEKGPAEPKKAEEEKKDVEEKKEPAPEEGKKETETPEKKVEVKKPSEVEVGILETKFGKMVIEFYPDLAPKTVKRIKELIGKGFYDGLTFHRIAPEVCIQGGDNGTGGTGVKIPGEFSSTPYVKGSLGMARTKDRNSNDSQFFIALARKPQWDNNYTLFGKVIEGLEVLDKIVEVPLEGPRGYEKPKEKVHILSFRLEKRKLEK